MNNILSDNAIIIIVGFFVFTVLLFRKELAGRLRNLKLDEVFFSSLNLVFGITTEIVDDIKAIEDVLADGKITADEVRDILIRLGSRKTSLEELLKKQDSK